MANLQTVLQYWKNFDLPNLQRELDDKATDLANRQDESENSRKKLVEMCRDFKKNSDEETKKTVTPVLKCFQGEVDSLSKRSKVAEAAFLALYKKIIETPDPTPSLDSVAPMQKKLQKFQDLEIENQNLKETLNQYNQEFAEVKNQEVIIRQLKEKIRSFEEQSDLIVKTKLVEKEQLLLKTFEEKEKRFVNNEHLLQTKLNDAESRAESFEKSLNAAQKELYTLKSHSDEMGSAQSSEMDLILSDLEKASLRAATAEQEVEMIREQVMQQTKINPEIYGSSESTQRSIDVEMAVKDRQVSQLLDEITQLKMKAENDIVDKTKQSENIQQTLIENDLKIQKLEEKISSHCDYDEIKRELNMLKCIYLGDNASIDEQQKLSSVVDPKSLELLLLDKNKSLLVEKTSLFNKNRNFEKQLNSTEVECKNLTVVCNEQKNLILKLEEDLMMVNRVRGLESEVFSTVPSDMSSVDLISDAVGYNRSIVRETSPTNAESLLPIVSNQRERLRVRVQELEEYNMQHQQNLALLNGELDRLRADNVKLYEKIKFLQSYQGEKSAGVGGKLGDEVLKKYSGDYEATLDPFRRFGAQERSRRYMSLSAHDKATLSISRVIMSSGTARALFLFYLLVLHCLVFLVLYKLAYTESCQRDAATDCVVKYREHMQMVHGSSADGHKHP